MLARDSQVIAQKARQLFESSLQKELEQTAFGRFVVIEPESGEYFLGNTFDEAVNAAIDKYPDRLTHTIRIGHTAAIHIGVLRQ